MKGMVNIMQIGTFTNVCIRKTNGTDHDFKYLNARLNEYIAEALYGRDTKIKFEPLHRPRCMDFVMVLYVNNRPVGCGAYRKINDQTAELKKFFLKDGYRGKKLSKLIMDELLSTCKENGYNTVLLETRDRLDASIALSQSAGFEEIPNYPPYDDIDDAVCMKLDLK